MSAKGVESIHIIERNLNAKQYVRILEDHLIEDGTRLCGKNFIMQADNDPKHKSRLVQKWLARNKIEQVSWPSNSPDMSQIEYMFHALKKNLRDRDIRSVQEFKRIIIEEWSYLPVSLTRSLVNSMPRRTEALWKTKGSPTKYCSRYISHFIANCIFQ
ncbi:MAG: putative Transposable element Tc1 transposase [Streblomastix strix]|uniref:Putative Transposable element Tc1 transposase n=1 Tax=Streblomastix strix TaxID=222440 RepID=A0A5J4VMR5_9EUKA|nr:MAG: putative Transposable element Tc1 transposase [Streblomastix strix]